MNHDTEQLNETFAAHEHLAPDAADVLAKAHRIARSYQRRRWAVRATGGAVLGAGLVAGGIALPGRWGDTSPSGSISSLQSASGADASPSAAPGGYTQDEEWAAYFAAGYDYNDAQQLAQLWNDTDSIGAVKAAAGLKLLEGQQLPIQPSGTPESPAQKAQAAYFAAGYDYDDAVSLAKLWHESDITQVKTEAGQKLLDGQSLPVKPTGPADSTAGSPGVAGGKPYAASKKALLAKSRAAKRGYTSSGSSSVINPQDEIAIQVFFGAGYDYNDAVSLGALWNDSNTLQVKADAGKELLAGRPLPVKPSGTPETQAEQAEAAFFAAGYDYTDAVRLGAIWHDSDITQVKTYAGQKLLNGQKLPIAP